MVHLSSGRLSELRAGKLFIEYRGRRRSSVVSLLAVFFGLTFAQFSAYGQVTVNTVIATFKATQRPVQNITIGNSSSNAAYVLARVERVLDPEDGGNKSEDSEDILVSPKAFSIEPNGQRSVRLLLRKPPPEKETVYRALFVPQDRGFGQEIVKEHQGRRASIRVLTGMGVLIFVEPKVSERKFTWIRNEHSIAFRNDGTLHEELSNGQHCDAKGEDCKPLAGKRVYAGSTYEVKVDGERKVTFLRRSGSAGEFEQMTVEPVGAVQNHAASTVDPTVLTEP